MLRRIGSTFAAAAALSCGIALSASTLTAQTTARAGSGAPSVTGKASSERIRFTAPSTVVQMKVEIVSESGVPVFDVTSRGSVFDWSMKGGDGEVVPDGSYVCVITLKSLNGKLSQRVGTVSFAGGRAALSPEARLTPGQQGAVGPIEEDSKISVLAADVPSATVVGHDGRDGQVTATTGDLTFKTGDVFSGTETERMRIKADGNVAVQGMIQARQGYGFMDGTKLTVDEKGGLRVTHKDGTFSPTVAGTGTQNRVAKWLETGGNGTLGDSLIYENNGFVGINTSSPGNLNGVQFATVPLHLNRIGNSAYMAVDAEGAGSYAGVILNRNSASANNHMWVMDSQPAAGSSSLLAFSTYSDAGNPTARLAVLRSGYVGINTTGPRTFLDVKSTNGEAARFNGGNQAFITIAENDQDRGYVGSYAGATTDVDFGTYGSNGTGKLHLTIQDDPKLTIDTAGQISQPVANGGLVKAAAAIVSSATTPTVARSFNNLQGGTPITVSRLGVGTYQVDFGVDITSRYYLATPGGPTTGSVTGQISIAQRLGNANALFIEVRDSAGTLVDNVNYNLVIF